MYTNAVLKINKIKCYKYAFIHGSHSLFLSIRSKLPTGRAMHEQNRIKYDNADNKCTTNKFKQKTKVCPQSIYLNAIRLNSTQLNTNPKNFVSNFYTQPLLECVEMGKFCSALHLFYCRFCIWPFNLKSKRNYTRSFILFLILRFFFPETLLNFV